jgi:hypothetical protein
MTMKHSMEDVVQLLRNRVGGQWEGSEIDGRDAILDVLRGELGYSNHEAHEMFDALLASGELRYRRVEGGELPPGDRNDISAEADGAVAPAIVPGAVGGIGLNGPGTGGTGIFPAAVGAGLGGGFWQIGHSQGDELPPMAGRKGQVDPTA